MFTGDVFKQTKRNNRSTEFKQNKHLTLIKMVREGVKNKKERKYRNGGWFEKVIFHKNKKLNTWSKEV